MEKISKNNEDENIPHMNIINKDFKSFSRSEQIRHLEVEGYLVIPNALNEQQINDVKLGMSDAGMLNTGYITQQTK